MMNTVRLSRRAFSTTTTACSKVGKQTLRVPIGVEITQTPYTIESPPPPSHRSASVELAVKGPLGALSMPLLPFVQVAVQGEAAKRTLSVSVAEPEERKQKAMWGTTRRLVEGLVEGVTEGFVVPIRLVGVGYRAAVENGQVSLKLGHSHPVVEPIPEGVTVAVPAPQRLVLSGIDKQKVTQFAANIRKHRPPEPYNQKGVFVGDETIRKKEGKKR
ncbi:hypothetical protein HDU79_001283 [Rhizoclosmatium sp. JEL0117]|nr:hypothetical protein HDU79_001283 [Rhizoclosmatium sp. JEL0117]